jgi:mRNA interferase MazF
MIRGKVVLVRFPFDDLSAVKVRPAVCLCDPVGPHRHVVVAFLTSHIPPKPLDSDLVLDSGLADFSTTGLHRSSTLCLHRLLTISVSLILRELGEISPRMQAKVDSKLRKLFCL